LTIARRVPDVPDSAAVQAHRNLADVIRYNLQNGHGVADRPALIWQRESLTWAELDAQVNDYARGLSALVGGGRTATEQPPRVAIALPNRPEFVALFYGILRAGLIAVPINPGYTARELRGLLADSGASVLVGTGEVLATLADEDLPALAHRFRLGQPVADDRAEPLDALPAGGSDAPGTARGGDDLAVLLYTSGTEGTPKGAMLSHRALLANHAQLDAIVPPPISADDVVLLAVPLFHAYGLNSGVGAVAVHGATGVLVEAFDPAESLRLIAAHRVTAVIGVPTMFLAWSLLPDLGDGFASVRVAVSGAAPLETATARRFLEVTGHPVFVGYGLTESAPVLATTLASPVPKPGSIGRAIPDVEIKLVSAGGDDVWRSTDVTGGWPDDDFDDDSSGSPGTDPGEIVVRGANLFSGYWPDGRDAPDADGWWATGDVAYADADGDLFLVDRKRELILVNGFNVYPLEVEHVLMSHPAVAEAAVLGVPHPYSGQTVKAYVVTSAPVGVEELLRHCERNLARFKCPTAIEFTTDLPYSATGKVRKAALRERMVPS
jgi:long-chain acyl-CoA synthetase